jgi:hypothetical protein
MLTTYLLRRDAEPSEMLARFIDVWPSLIRQTVSTLPTMPEPSDERTGIMNRVMLLMLTVALTACGSSQPSETVDFLAAIPSASRRFNGNARKIAQGW